MEQSCNDFHKLTLSFACIADNITERLTHVIIHQTHYEKSDWSRAFDQFTLACELNMINQSPLECFPQKQNG